MKGGPGTRCFRRALTIGGIASIAAAAPMAWLTMTGFAAGPAASIPAPDIIFANGDAISGTEPVTVGADSTVGRFVDPDNVPIQLELAPRTTQVIPACGDTSVYSATINWGDGSTGTARVECDSSETSQYAVIVDQDHTYQDSGTYKISVTVNDHANDAPITASTATLINDPDTAQTDTATVGDAEITSGGAESSGSKVEGGTVTVRGAFFDPGSGRDTHDSGLTASIDWGDGTSSPADSIGGCDCEGNILVTGTHVYDANKADESYSVTISLTDDGGAKSSAKTSVTIADAALTAGTAKTFTATAGSGVSPVVASFTDAAGGQAAAADFTASIKWGDGATTAGTLSKTGSGAFNVSGSHTYASAGTRTLTITVTDEEGQTLSMTATATVNAAPIVLPATGQANSAGGSWPLALLALIALGTLLMALGIGRARRQAG